MTVATAAADRPLPRMRTLDALKSLLASGGGRIDMRSTLTRLHATYGPVVQQFGGIVRIVNLFGPDANRAVLLDRDEIFSAEQPWTAIMGRIFPNGLLLRDGDVHRQHRKIMHEAFVKPILREYLANMQPRIASGLDAWADAGGALLAFPAYKRLTLQIAASIFLGVELGPEERRMNRAFEDMVAAAMSRIRLPIPGLEFTRGLRGRAWMVDFLRRQLAARRSGSGADMLSRLCHARTEDGHALDDTEVVDHMVFLMMAAHDTTTSALSSLTYALARHPEWQEMLRAESRYLGTSWLSLAELDRLEQLGFAIQETLRMYPPLPVIPRVALRDFEWEGFPIRAGTMVVLSPIHTHYMPEWWSEPERFDPNRFAKGRAEQSRHSHSWVPFGGGPHMCLGKRFAELQLRAVMHQLLLRFRWSVPDDYRMPVQQAPISKPRDGLPIRLERLA